ncbi:hypothetical protein ABPG74_010942 [Tetrahymena malaccensis]
MFGLTKNLLKFAQQANKMNSILNKTNTLQWASVYNYAPQKVVLRNEKSGYYANPDDVARRLIRLISLHDKVQNPSAITLKSTWSEIGVDPLSYVEIMLEAENEFYIELADEDLERFRTVEDAVEFISRNFFTN